MGTRHTAIRAARALRQGRSLRRDMLAPARGRINVRSEQRGQIRIASAEEFVGRDLAGHSGEQVGDLDPWVGSRIHLTESDEVTLSREADQFERRRGQDLLESSHPPLGQRGLLVVDDRDRMQSTTPMEHGASEGGNQRFQHGLQDVILKQPGASGIGFLPSVAQLVEDCPDPTATVQGPEHLDLTEERVDRGTHSAAAVVAQDHVARGQERLPGFPAEGVRAGAAEPGRQARQSLVRAQAQARRVHGAPDEQVENPAQHEAGLVGQMNPARGRARDRTGRETRRGPIRPWSAAGARPCIRSCAARIGHAVRGYTPPPRRCPAGRWRTR